MWQWVILAVEAQQARYIDHSLIHLAPLGLPRHLLQQILKERAGPTHPTGQQINPSPTTQRLAGDHAAQWSERQAGNS
jgi:hypothetical protein